MKSVVLDTSAFLAYFYGEPGGDRIASLIEASDCNCFMHAANVIEVCYKIAKNRPDLVSALHRLIVSTYVLVEHGLDDGLQRDSALLKVKYPMLSLADTIAISLAERFGCEIYTTDREFSRVENGVEVVQLR